MTKRFWRESWKAEIQYPDDDPDETQRGIEAFLASEDIRTVAGVMQTAATGLTADVTLAEPPPQHAATAPVVMAPVVTTSDVTASAVTAPAVPVKQEVQISSYCSQRYDEVHNMAVKTLTE